MNCQQLIAMAGRHWNPTAATMYRVAHRTVESHSAGSWVFDEDGRRFLDFACSYGVFIVGHCNPHVQERVIRQIEKLAASPYGTANATGAEFFKVLTDMLPGDLKRVYFANSGAEISELTMRAVLAIQAPRKKIIVIRNSYHGKTLGALNLLGQQNHRAPFLPLSPDVSFVPWGDLEAMQREVGAGAAAVFLEPVLGGAYLQTPPPGYVRGVAELCQKTDTLFVADEIQTAFGRCGRMFAIEYDPGIQPDIMLLSKGITGGHSSIAVAVMRESLVRKLEAIPGLPARYLATDSGGSPYACAAALAAIEFIREHNLPAQAEKLGARLLGGLRDAARKHPALILDAPGIGLMTGLRVRNPAVETAITIGLGKRGIHVGHSMNESAQHPVLRFYPALTVTEAEIDQVLAALNETLATLDRKPAFVFDLMNQIVKRQYRLPPKVLFKLAGVKD
ncbi:aspartate aminotransferase family protein [Chitiniphilus purpureus]|uniref:Aspartate aminotransferase family protein n=1 Tax=Chitiniphilus purpureus TaxID=2981137 RepID=A0ABY6DSD8_9NEIS|nr:aspartate aminotransferase family protein [Chitiniphilus sp. CD1]UXY17148.1 aspartate aminotransferase family protein [Chitiniphilus sp. CD1]